MKISVPKYVANSICGLKKKDFKVQFFRSSGPGGQHRNKVETAVRITHLDTGISSESSDSKSREQNKKKAFRKLALKLIDHYRTQEVSNRRTNLGWGEKIRTYNEVRGSVKDHRTKVTLPFDRVLDGKIDPFIESMARMNILIEEKS